MYAQQSGLRMDIKKAFALSAPYKRATFEDLSSMRLLYDIFRLRRESDLKRPSMSMESNLNEYCS